MAAGEMPYFRDGFNWHGACLGIRTGKTEQRKARTMETKNHMARVIIQALFNLPAIPDADDRRVVRCERTGTARDLASQYTLAVRVLAKNSENSGGKTELYRFLGQKENEKWNAVSRLIEAVPRDYDAIDKAIEVARTATNNRIDRENSERR